MSKTESQKAIKQINVYGDYGAGIIVKRIAVQVENELDKVLTRIKKIIRHPVRGIFISDDIHKKVSPAVSRMYPDAKFVHAYYNDSRVMLFHTLDYEKGVIRRQTTPYTMLVFKYEND